LEADNEVTPGSAPEYDVLIGETKPTPQFGIIGAMSSDASRHVALDLNGCNTISVFGVQGSGKSYTVGTIIEMSTIAIPAINALPKPLGSVVFHFNQTQDYPPEFVTMNEPNIDPVQTKMLAEWGAKPGQIDDILVLTTNDTIDLRREEFPQATVEPITFSSTELTIADWRFLIGATSNDALYLKLLNEVMRRARNNLTLQTIRDGITQAPLSDSQRLLAFTRLDFAARFINDEKSLRSLLRPGRLIIVDLRDEFVEKEQALGLCWLLGTSVQEIGPIVHDRASFLAKVCEIRVQSSRSILCLYFDHVPIFTKKRFHSCCVYFPRSSNASVFYCMRSKNVFGIGSNHLRWPLCPKRLQI
jgi:DNA phosphorothioation-dependent restriction protein DptH